MPTYTFYDEASGIQWDDMMSISEKEDFLKNNQQITQVPVDSGWKEVMSKISEAHPKSPLADRYGGPTKTHNEIKTREVLKKHGVL